MQGFEKIKTVKKRDGTEVPFDLSKIEKQLQKTCEGIEHVSPFVIATAASAQFYDGMGTDTIDDVYYRAMVNLIDPEFNSAGHTNYQWVAGRQKNIMLRKAVFGSYDIPRLYDIVKRNVEAGMYEPLLLVWYSEAEWDEMDKFVVHSRDEVMSSAAIEQVIDKYLVQNRFKKIIYETPQIRYIIISAVEFHAEKQDVRLQWVKQHYNEASTRGFSQATPVCGGVGTPTKQFSSCVKISVADSISSIYAAGEAVGRYAAKRAGIGLEFGMIRAPGAPIRGGEIMHTGVIPFVHKWFRDLRAVSQGVRNASASFNYPLWHYQFEDLIVLKNNQGTDESRVRHVDYVVQLNGFLLERIAQNKQITFFDPHEVEGLYDAFISDSVEFERIYLAAEANPSISRRRTMGGEEVGRLLFTERLSTSRIYLMFMDNVQRQSSFDTKKAPIRQTNLCTEVLLHTRTFETINDEDGRIALCTLGAINFGKFLNPQDMRDAVRALYRGLHNLLQYQDFPLIQAKLHNDEYEPLGIGLTGLAEWFARRGFKYGEPTALQELKRWMDHFYYYMMEMNVELAEEKGPCKKYTDTIYADGAFIFEKAKPYIKNFVDLTPEPELDYEQLRARMIKSGVRNATTGAQPPVESSSLVIDSTNGTSKVKQLVTTKISKKGNLVQVVPGFNEYGDKYELLWDTKDPAAGYLRTLAVVQVYMDQGMSVDTPFNPGAWPSAELPYTHVLNTHIELYNLGHKTAYYSLYNKQGLADRLIAPSQTIKADLPPGGDDEDGEFCSSCVL